MFEIRELQKIEDKLRVRYSKLSKIFPIITVLFIIWIIFVALGVFLFELEYNWALLSLENWVYACCILIGFFVILELVLYFHYTATKGKKLKKEKPRPEFIHGKRLYVYTYPAGAEGGIYSKTYVNIDENHVLRLRALMVPPDELWGKQEEK